MNEDNLYFEELTFDEAPFSQDVSNNLHDSNNEIISVDTIKLDSQIKQRELHKQKKNLEKKHHNKVQSFIFKKI